MPAEAAALVELLETQRADILREWIEALAELFGSTPPNLEEDAGVLLDQFLAACALPPSKWLAASDEVSDLGRSRVAAGFSTDETIAFVSGLRTQVMRRGATLEDAALLAKTSRLFDVFLERLMLAFVEARDRIIAQQQEDLLELSTPAVQLWDGIVAMPLVGTLDSRRAVVVMETLLQKVVETRSSIAIIDITGVPTVDTLVAQHLLRTTAAARLIGARCILCGIRPQIAQTMVDLGIELHTIETCANVAAAFERALAISGRVVTTAGAVGADPVLAQ